MKKILVTVMALVLTVSVQAQIIIDLTKENSVVVPLDNRIERIDTLVLQRDDVNIQSIPNANLLVNDSLVMLGAMDEAVFRIQEGSLVRRMNEQPFNQAQMMGEPAVHPGSALLDSSGQFCYAWGNAIVGGRRINFIKKMDFYTGEVVDSIDVNSGDFSLSKDDSLRLAVNNDFLTCFPEYTFHLPSEGRVTRIRFFGRDKMWIRLSHDGRRDNYICNQDGTQVKRIMQIVYRGQNIDPHSIIGFSPYSLASTVKTETGYIITIFHLKNEE